MQSVFIMSLILTLMQISVSCHTAAAFPSTCVTYGAKVSLDKTNTIISSVASQTAGIW